MVSGRRGGPGRRRGRIAGAEPSTAPAILYSTDVIAPGSPPASGPVLRLPFSLDDGAGPVRLVLAAQPVLDWLVVDHLELDVPGQAPDPAAPLEHLQRRRTRLRAAAVRIDQRALDRRAAAAAAQLADAGVTQLAARLAEGYVAVRCRFVDGLAQADVTFHLYVVGAGATVRVAAGAIRVLGYVPVPGPLIADRILAALLGLTDAGGKHEARVRGLCDVEIDVLDAVLWQLLPPHGWRLPALADVELAQARTSSDGIVVGYARAGARASEGDGLHLRALTAAHDAMRSADELLRQGALEDAMRGYRALLASGGPDQPVVLERLLAIAAARPGWFLDGVELARQALARWPKFMPAHGALAVIAFARGDARESARHFGALADLAAAERDLDTGALAALAGARLVRVVDPGSATRLLELAVDLRPELAEAADALIERYAEDGRWTLLVAALRARAVRAVEPVAAAGLLVRAAEVLAGPLHDAASARAELTRAGELAGADLSTLRAIAVATAVADGGGSHQGGAERAWTALLRAAEGGDAAESALGRTARAEAWTALAGLASDDDERGAMLRRAVAADGTSGPARLALARWAARRGDHAQAIEQFASALAGGLDPASRTRAEVDRAECLLAVGDRAGAEGALRRASAERTVTGALAHALLARLALDDLAGLSAVGDAGDLTAVAQLDGAIASSEADVDRALEALAELADGAPAAERDELDGRACELATARARLRDRRGDRGGAALDWERAYRHSHGRDNRAARTAALARLATTGPGSEDERRWLDAALATDPVTTGPAGPVGVDVGADAASQGALLLRRARLLAATGGDPTAALRDLAAAIPQLTDPAEVAAGHALDAELRERTGDLRVRAQAMTERASWTPPGPARRAVELAAAQAWLDADAPGPALEVARAAAAGLEPPGAGAIDPAEAAAIWTLVGEAGWRARSWPDVIAAGRARAASGASATTSGPGLAAVDRYRLAFALDRAGEGAASAALLAALVAGELDGGLAASVHRLRVEQAERTGSGRAIAEALEALAATVDDSASASASATTRADAWQRAAELHRRDGDLDDAARCCEAALRLVEQHLPALDCLELVERARGDLERVAVILGRKIAATARHPQRQKALLARLGELWLELGHPDVARATFARALELDGEFRPALRFHAADAADRGAWAEALAAYRALAGRLAGDHALDDGELARERAAASAELERLGAAVPAPLREGLGLPPAAAAASPRAEAGPTSDDEREPTHSGRVDSARATAAALRAAAEDARRLGRLGDAFAQLETANNLQPGDPEVLRDLADLAVELGDHPAAAGHLHALAEALVAHGRASRRGDVLLELADLYGDQLGDRERGRATLWAAAEALTGARRDATLRLLATDAVARRDWQAAVRAYQAIDGGRRTAADLVALGTVLHRAGRLGDAKRLLDEAATAGRLDPEGVFLQLALAREVDADRAQVERVIGRDDDGDDGARSRLTRALHLYRDVVGDHQAAAAVESALAALPDAPEASVEEDQIITDVRPATRPDLGPGPAAGGWAGEAGPIAPDPVDTLPGQAPAPFPANLAAPVPRDEAELIAELARRRGADPELLHGWLAYAEPRTTGRVRAHLLMELAFHLRDHHGEAARAAALLHQAHAAAPDLVAVWLPLADVLAGGDDVLGAIELYEQAAASDELDPTFRAWARARAEALASDDTVIGGELGQVPARTTLPMPAVSSDGFEAISHAFPDATTFVPELGLVPPPPPAEPALEAGVSVAQARDLAGDGDLLAAIGRAEHAAALSGQRDPGVLAVLDELYAALGDLDAQTEILGRQLQATIDPAQRAQLWRRRARMYRGVPQREAEAHRCLLEAHALAPDDPELAFELRMASMARGQWALAAQLLYREIAAASSDRDRGALHLELALIYDDRLGNPDSARLNYEQALHFDPTIPAALVRLAGHYEAAGRGRDAARLYDDAAALADGARRTELARLADQARAAGGPGADRGRDPAVVRLERDLEAARAHDDVVTTRRLAHHLWGQAPGHPDAFAVLSDEARARGDLTALATLATARAAALPPGRERAEVWFDLGRRQVQADLVDDAVATLDRALIEDASHVGALDTRAEVALRLEDWATADVLYAHVGPDRGRLAIDDLLVRRSEIAERLGRDRDALGLAQAAARANPLRRDVQLRVAHLARACGDLAGARAAAQAVVALTARDDRPAAAAARLELAELAEAGGDLDAAVSQLELILLDDPFQPLALARLVDLHRARGRFPMAARHLRTLIGQTEAPRQRAALLADLGDLLGPHLGDDAGADDAYLRAADLDPGNHTIMRRLIDTYWRGREVEPLVEVCTELAGADALVVEEIDAATLARAAIGLASSAALHLARRLLVALGDPAATLLAGALGELVGDGARAKRGGGDDDDGSRLTLADGCAAVRELMGHRTTPNVADVIAAAWRLPPGVGDVVAEALGQA